MGAAEAVRDLFDFPGKAQQPSLVTVHSISENTFSTQVEAILDRPTHSEVLGSLAVQGLGVNVDPSNHYPYGVLPVAEGSKISVRKDQSYVSKNITRKDGLKVARDRHLITTS